MERVKTGKERQQRYADEYTQFKKAYSSGFYLEALAIGYAIIEDRLVAFLHHAGIVSRDVENLKITNRVYPYMRRLMDKDENVGIKVKNISVKINLIRKLLSMTEEQATEIDGYIKSDLIGKRRSVAQPGYMQDLYKQINNLDREAILVLLEKIEPWTNMRNQLIHALLSKKTDAVSEGKQQCAEVAKDLTRDLDNLLVKRFKKNNNLRKKYRIQ